MNSLFAFLTTSLLSTAVFATTPQITTAPASTEPLFAGTPASQVRALQNISFSELPADVQQALHQILRDARGLSGWGVAVSDELAVNNFFEQQIGVTDHIEEAGAGYSARRSRYTVIPAGSEGVTGCAALPAPGDSQIQFGCTSHDQTYLFMSAWSGAAASRSTAMEQAFAIVRLRLQALHLFVNDEEGRINLPDPSPQEISATIEGLRVLGPKLRQQLQGDRTALTTAEKTLVGDYQTATRRLGWIADGYHQIVQITEGGGAIVGSVPQIENSFIGLGSVIDGGDYGRPIVIRDSTLIACYMQGASALQSTCLTTHLQTSGLISSTIDSSDVTNVRFNHAQIERSHLDGNRDRHSGDTADISFIHIKNSDIHLHSVNGTAAAPIRIEGVYGDLPPLRAGASVVRNDVSFWFH